MSSVRVISFPKLFEMTGRETTDRPWIEGGTILDYWGGDSRLVCVYNGRCYESKDWGKIRPEPGAELFFTEEVEGIGASIISAIAGFTAASSAAPVVGATGAIIAGAANAAPAWVAIVGALVDAGLTLGVSLAANQFFGANDIGEDLLPAAEPQVHRFGGAQTTAQSGSTIPIGYGEHLMAGNIIGSKLAGNLVPPLVTGAPTLTIRPAILDMTVALCVGPIGGISEIKINGNDIENYSDGSLGVQVITRLGEEEQEPTFFFSDVGAADDVPVGIALENQTDVYGGVPEDWVESTMTRAASRVRININHPTGLYYAAGSSIYDTGLPFAPEGVIWGVRYKLEGAPDEDYSDWVDYGFAALVGETFQTFCEIELPTRDVYTLQVRKTRPLPAINPALVHNDIEWQSFTQITEGAFSFPGRAYFAARVYTNSDLLAGTPNFTCRAKLRRVDSYDPDTETWSYDEGRQSNNAWCAIDVLVDEEEGLGQWYSRGPSSKKMELELESWVEFAEHCDELVDDGKGGLEPRYRFDGVFENGEAGWEAVRRILAPARAFPLRRGFRLGVQWHHDRVPTMKFGRHNMEPGSFAVKYTDTLNRPTRYNVRYLNRARDFTPDVEPVSDLDAIDATGILRSEDLDMFGIIRKSHARRHGQWRLNLLKYGDRVISWKTQIKAIFCEVGDVVWVANPRLRWGVADGSIEAATASTFTVDTDFELVEGVEYWVRVQHQADDVIEERVISSAPGQYFAGDELTISEDWDATPEVDATYSIGSPISEPRQVLITSIRATDEFHAQIVGIRYDPRIHDDTIMPIEDLPDVTLPTPAATPPCLATPPTLTEVFEGGEARIQVSWQYSAPLAGGGGLASAVGGARIYLRRATDGVWSLVGSVDYPVSAFTIGGLATDVTYQVTVIQRSPTGAHLQPGQCAASEIELVGLGPVPPAVTGVAATQFGPNLRVTWNAVSPPPAYYEIRRGEKWVLSQPVGTSTTTQLQTDQWSPPLTSEPQADRFFVRAVSATGLYGQAGVVELDSLALWFASSAAVTQDEFTLGWLGTKTNLEVNGDGFLELTDPALPGEYLTGAIDLGAIGNFRIGAVLWARATLGPNLGSQTYTLGSRQAKTWSSDGPNNPDDWIVGLDIDVRVATTSPGLSSAPWFPLSSGVEDAYGARYFELRLTLSTSDTDWLPIIDYLAVTAEELP